MVAMRAVTMALHHASMERGLSGVLEIGHLRGNLRTSGSAVLKSDQVAAEPACSNLIT